MDFIYKLYNSDNFVLILTIILIVLVILFVIVLIFGKKDQKLEETKRLQKIELEHAFKEEDKEPVKLETEIKEDALPLEHKEEVKTPFESDAKREEKEVNVFVFEPKQPDIKEEKEEIQDIDLPKRENREEEGIISLEEMDLDDINASLTKDLTNLENIKKEFGQIEIPEIEESNAKTIEQTPKEFKPSTVFSSVYAKDTPPEDNTIIKIEDDSPAKPVLFDQEDDFDLPDLVTTEVKKETPEEPLKNIQESTFTFDDIANETYKLK